MSSPRSTYFPRRSRTTHSETLNDEICVYEWTTKRVHALNATAARVWHMCDGRATPRPQGGSGGGGSSYTDPAATSVIHTQGSNPFGNGQIVFSW